MYKHKRLIRNEKKKLMKIYDNIHYTFCYITSMSIYEFPVLHLGYISKNVQHTTGREMALYCLIILRDRDICMQIIAQKV